MAGYPLRRFQIGSGIVPGPLVDERERIYVAGLDGTVSCFEPRTGDRMWQHAPAGPIRGGFARAGDRIYVADTTGAVLAMGAADGAVAWCVEPGRGVRGGIAVDAEGMLVTGHEDGHVRGFETDGRIRWATPLGLPVRTPPRFDPDGNVVLPGLDLHLTSLHPSDGAVRWRRPLGNVAVGPAAVSSDGLVVVATLAGELLAVTAIDGAARWTRTLGEAVVGGVVRLGAGWAVVTVSGRVLGLDEQGETRWEGATAGPVGAPPVVGPAPVEGQPDWMFVVSRSGVFAVFDAEGRCQARWDPWVGQPRPCTRALTGVARGEHGVVISAEAGQVLYAPWNAPDLAPEGWAVRPREEAVVVPPMPSVEGAPPLPFRATCFTLTEPAVAPALDGLAGVEMHVVMLAEHEDTAIAWGTVTHAEGVERIGWNARRAGAGWIFEATHASLPWMGLRVPLSRLELTVGEHWAGLYAVSQVAPRLPSWMGVRDHPSAALERSGKPFLAAQKLWSRLTSGPPSLKAVVDFGQGAARALGALPRFADANVWGAWGLLDETRRFEGRGFVAIQPLPPTEDRAVVIDEVHAEAGRRLVTVTLTGDEEARRSVPVSVLLVDTRSTPVVIPMDYSRRTRVVHGEDEVPTDVMLEIPLDTNLARPVEVWVVVGARLAWQGPLTSRVG